MHDANLEVLSLPSPLGETAPVEQVLRKTPWWSVSLGIHVLLALLLGWFWVVQARDPEEVIAEIEPFRRTVPVRWMDSPPERDTQKRPPLDLPRRAAETYFKKDPNSDHVETADEQEFEKAQDDSLDFVGDKPFKGRGIGDTIGTGPNGGGRYGQRLSGKRDLWGIGGGSPQTEDAVLQALKWLSRHQNPDGSWSTAGYVKNCKEPCLPAPGHEDFDGGNTGLAILAFLGAGYSHLSKDTYDGICFGDVVRKGLQWMMAHQDPEGCIGSRNAQKYMYNHTICALAMSEAYGLTGSNLFKDQAQKAVDFVIAAQNPGKGWRYSFRCGDNDSSVTGWAVMVLKSAELSALSFPRTGYDGARAWYDEVTEESYPHVGYDRRGTGKVYVPGVNEHFEDHPALTAIGVMCRLFMDRRRGDPRLSMGCDLLLKDLPKWEGNWIDFYYWYYASLALFQYDGPSGPKWKGWNEPMKEALVPRQNRAGSGCRRGSWEPVDRWSCEGGRVYATAINALTLEVYYRYPVQFAVRKG